MSSSAASIIYLGMDVHKDSITIAVLPMTAKNPTRLERLPNDLPKLKRFLDRTARDGELRVCYEAEYRRYKQQCRREPELQRCVLLPNARVNLRANQTKQAKRAVLSSLSISMIVRRQLG